MFTPQDNFTRNAGIITHRSENDGGTLRNVSMRGLPVPESLCYSPAGDRPAQPCPGLVCSPVSGKSTRSPATGTRTKGLAISRDLRINQMIRVFDVRVVDEDGSQLGVMRTADALRLAQERGLDLVEVAPLASPPVARLLDFGQYKYELTKREKEAKRRQRSVTFKEVRLKPKIGIGDFDTKVRRAIEFLEEGDRVKVAVQFRGRELTHPQIGRDLLDKFAEQIKEHGVVERAPMLEGKSMHISVASVHKPKAHEPTPAAAAKSHAGTDEDAASAPDAAVEPDSAETPANPAAPGPEPEDGAASNGKVN
jgi:translation initiation factor IF-3